MRSCFHRLAQSREIQGLSGDSGLLAAELQLTLGQRELEGVFQATSYEPTISHGHRQQAARAGVGKPSPGTPLLLSGSRQPMADGRDSNVQYGAKQLFKSWLNRCYPDRQKRALNRIRETRGGGQA